jgi:tRNA threonylcarbamoyladenosine biosynthesis protein TsaB
MILCLETATNLCSVALCNKERVVALRESSNLKSHASSLTVFIQEILKETGEKPADLEAVAVSKGPGSYTGLRIGVSVAKGIAFAASIPMIGIETTYSMFCGMAKPANADQSKTFYCPMIDARRMEVYYAIYDYYGNTIKDISAEVMNEDSFNDIPHSNEIIFFGDGALKFRDIFKRPNIKFEAGFSISASDMRIPAYKAFEERRFEDVAYFEPFYLKDFITTKQRKNILGR